MEDNPFSSHKSVRKGKETLQKSALRLVTYAILGFTLFVFGLIIWRGAPVLAQYGWEFLQRKPESLEVIAFDEAKGLEIPTSSFQTMLTYNPEEGLFTNVSDTTRTTEYTTFQIEPGSIISDGYLTDVEVYNDFNPGYIMRDDKAPVGFEIVKDTRVILQPETYENLIASAPELQQLEKEVLNLQDVQYEVTFEAREDVQMQAKTLAVLQNSFLIYKLYGNLLKMADDQPNELMPLSIPRDQTVLFTPAQYNAYQQDSGNAKFGEGREIIENYERVALTIPEGHYILPFDQLKALVTDDPAAAPIHGHNIDRGVIYLDLKKATKQLLLPNEEFASMVKDNPKLNISNVEVVEYSSSYKRFDLSKAASIKMPTTDMSALRGTNAAATDANGQGLLKSLSEKVFPYSSGGVSGPMIGTGLLVLICITIALFIGVAAAIYLGEYARPGKLISSIRLSMMNLAGVPSIVFGVFGLGLFVSLAPKITSMPSVEDKFRVPILPAFSEPDLRTQESRGIKMIDKNVDLIPQLRAAQQEGQKLYYTGWTYLSFQGWGNSLIAGAFTLAIMVLPIIITSSEESLRAVPMGFREASMALGATKWQSIKTAVLPYATPGILTASVLGITRVAGETAPIMFTAAVAAKSDLPFAALANGVGLDKFFAFISQSVQAMPYHIYTISGRLPPSHYIKPMQYGSVLVFMMVVMSFAALSVWLRIRMRKKYKW